MRFPILSCLVDSRLHAVPQNISLELRKHGQHPGERSTARGFRHHVHGDRGGVLVSGGGAQTGSSTTRTRDCRTRPSNSARDTGRPESVCRWARQGTATTTLCARASSPLWSVSSWNDPRFAHLARRSWPSSTSWRVGTIHTGAIRPWSINPLSATKGGMIRCQPNRQRLRRQVDKTKMKNCPLKWGKPRTMQRSGVGSSPSRLKTWDLGPRHAPSGRSSSNRPSESATWTGELYTRISI